MTRNRSFPTPAKLPTPADFTEVSRFLKMRNQGIIISSTPGVKADMMQASRSPTSDG